MSVVESQENRSYVAYNFMKYPQTAHAFPVARLSSNWCFESEEAQKVVAKVDDMADKRFEKYASDASNTNYRTVFKPSEKARYQEIVAHYTDQGKMIGTNGVLFSVAGVSYAAGFALGANFGGIPMLGASAAMSGLLMKDDSQSMQMMQGGALALILVAAPDELKASLCAAQAVAQAGVHLCHKLEWPTQMGGKIGESVGHYLGEWIAWWNTPNTPDLSDWKSKICEVESKALKGDIELLSKGIEQFGKSLKDGDLQKEMKEKDLKTLNIMVESLENRIKIVERIKPDIEKMLKISGGSK